MPTTYSLINSSVVTTTSVSSITFTSIPQTFTDLQVLYSARCTRASVNTGLKVTFNNETTNIVFYNIYNAGTTITSFTQTEGGQSRAIGYIPANSSTTKTFSAGSIYFNSYTNNEYKYYTAFGNQETNATTNNINFMITGQWQNTAAITSLIFDVGTDELEIGSSFYLYGISDNITTQNTSVPYATGGDIITTDGSYWYHTFLKSDHFIPWKNLSNVDYLVVAGGGGGGGFGGGGGAGGLRTTTSSSGYSGGGGSLESTLSLTAGTVYNAIVGAGAAGGDGTIYTRGYTGSDSTFGSITSNGGGGGAGQGQSATSGGSGGGGSSTGSQTGAAGTSNQGYAGGNAYSTIDPYYSSGAGGGAGGAGGNGTASTTVNASGGIGVTTSISGSSKTYAIGGDAGGVGAGQNGDASGAINSGSGGQGIRNVGGSGTGNGGSGIIIVRYAV